MSAIGSAGFTCWADFLAEVWSFGQTASLVVTAEICQVLVQFASCGPQCWLVTFPLPPPASPSDHNLLKIVIWEVLSAIRH